MTEISTTTTPKQSPPPQSQFHRVRIITAPVAVSSSASVGVFERAAGSTRTHQLVRPVIKNRRHLLHGDHRLSRTPAATPAARPISRTTNRRAISRAETTRRPVPGKTTEDDVLTTTGHQGSHQHHHRAQRETPTAAARDDQMRSPTHRTLSTSSTTAILATDEYTAPAPNVAILINHHLGAGVIPRQPGPPGGPPQPPPPPSEHPRAPARPGLP